MGSKNYLVINRDQTIDSPSATSPRPSSFCLLFWRRMLVIFWLLFISPMHMNSWLINSVTTCSSVSDLRFRVWRFGYTSFRLELPKWPSYIHYFYIYSKRNTWVNGLLSEVFICQSLRMKLYTTQCVKKTDYPLTIKQWNNYNTHQTIQWTQSSLDMDLIDSTPSNLVSQPRRYLMLGYCPATSYVTTCSQPFGPFWHCLPHGHDNHLCYDSA